MSAPEIHTTTQKFTVNIDPELQEIVPSFLENRQKDVETIRESMATRDYKTIQRIGHIMKGAGGGYGFDRITELGSSLEKAAQAEDFKKIEGDLGELVRYLGGIEIKYQ